MGRFGGLDGMPKARKGLVFAMIMASTAAFAASALADTTTGPATSHKAKHTSTAKSTAPKVAKALPGDCGPTPDQASIGIRALQTELMVAGLKCSADQWNTFTAKFKATIKTDADRLQHVFAKAYGKGGGNEMNAFVTQLANDASQRSNAFSEADYCKQEDVLFTKVLALTAQDLERFSAKRNVAVPQPVKLCAPDADPAVTTAAVTAPVGAVATPAVAITTATGKGATAPAKATPVVATAAPAAGTPSAH